MMADDESSSSSDDDIVHRDVLESSDDDDDDELGNRAATSTVCVKKTKQQSFTGTVTGLDQRVQEMLQSRDNTQLVPSSHGQQSQDTLALATGSGSQGGPNTTLIQLNVTQQQFGDVTVEKATHVNQMFGGSQNISKTATIYEGQRGKELNRADTIMVRTVSHFKVWNQGMVKTAALDQVLDKLKSGSSWLTIKGNPGEGKTTVGYMALEELHKCGRQVFEVRSPDEFTEVISTCPHPVIMLDDVFGNLRFDHSKWSHWEPVVSPVLKEREHKSHDGADDVTVILIGRDYVLNSASVDLGRLSDFLTSDKHVVCMDHGVNRSIDEKRAIWESLSKSSGVELEKRTVDEILTIDGPHGFPHVCRLFTTLYKENEALSAVEFFKKPLNFLNRSMSHLFTDTNKVMLFRAMVKTDGKISRKELRRQDGTYKIIQTANELVGSYLRFFDDCFTFDHPSIYDSVAFHLCSLDQEFVIQQCHLLFIHERIRLRLSEETKSTPASEPSLVVFIERSYEDDLAERFASEIVGQNFIYVLSHQAFRDGTFISKVMSKIKMPLRSLLQLEDRNVSSLSNIFLSFVPSSKSPELLKYIDKCTDIELTDDDEEHILYGTCKYAASEVLTYLKGTRKSLNINDSFNNQKFSSMGETSLMIAAETRDIEFVNQILSLKPDLTASDDIGRTSLHYLCEYGLVPLVSQVIDNGADIDVLDDENESPLCYACEYNQLEVVKLLLERGARVDETTLMVACRGGNLHVVELLFEKENNMNTDIVLTKALSAASQEGNTHIMDFLVDKGAHFPMPPLHAGCLYNRLQIVKWSLQRGEDVNSRDWSGDTALYTAVRLEYSECAVILLKAGAKVNIRNAVGNTPLIRAAVNHSKEFVGMLLKAGADVNIQNVDGYTALHRAVWSRTQECVDLLLKAGATVNVHTDEGDTPLHRAAGCGSSKCVEILLKEGATVNIQNKDGNTALHRATMWGAKECVYMLLKAGATVNIQNNEGDTSLHRAAINLSKECAEMLLKAGADVNMQNKEGYTALHKAVWSISKEVPDLLLKAGATVNVLTDEGDTVLHKAALYASSKCVELLLKAGAEVNIQNKEGSTALHRAAWNASSKCIKLLLKEGAEVNIQNDKGDTALHSAARRVQERCVDMLLNAGATVNIMNKNGDTALHIAQEMGFKSCVDVLLKAGATVNIQNKEG